MRIQYSLFQCPWCSYQIDRDTPLGDAVTDMQDHHAAHHSSKAVLDRLLEMGAVTVVDGRVLFGDMDVAYLITGEQWT